MSGNVQRVNAYGQPYTVTREENDRLDDIQAQLDAYEELYGDEEIDRFRPPEDEE